MAGRPKVWGLLVALGTLALVEQPGRAASQLFVTFAYQIDPGVRGCLVEGEIQGFISRQLAYDPISTGANDHVAFQVDPGERGLVGRVVWTDKSGQWKGERHFSAPSTDCEKLSLDMAFAVAVQIQLLAAEAAEAAPAAPAPRLTAPPAHTTVATPTTPRWRYSVGAGASGAWRIAPSTSLQARAFASAQRAFASIELGGEVSLPSTYHQVDGSGFTVFSLLGSAAGCLQVSRFSACGVGKAGQLRARGVGVDAPRSPSGLLVQAGPRLVLHQGLAGHLFVLAHAELLVTLVERTVTLNHVDVWTTPRLGGVAGLALGMGFP